MSKGNEYETDILKLLLNGEPIDGVADNAAASPLANLYVSAHNADPGEAGDQTTNETSYTSYARKAVARAAVIDSNSDSGSDFAVGNATIDGQAQSFANGSAKLLVTRVFAYLKKNNSPTGNIVCKIYAHSGSYGTSSVPTGTALATSENVDVSGLTGSYVLTKFKFTAGVVLDASTNYVVAFEYSGGDASNYVQIQGLASSGTHGGNRSDLISSSWSATAADDLGFSVEGSGFQVSGGVANPVDNIDWPSCTGGTDTLTHLGIGDLSSGAGRLFYKGTITPNIAVSTGAAPRVTTSTSISED